jgi:hypothetical protein
MSEEAEKPTTEIIKIIEDRAVYRLFVFVSRAMLFALFAYAAIQCTFAECCRIFNFEYILHKLPRLQAEYDYVSGISSRTFAAYFVNIYYNMFAIVIVALLAFSFISTCWLLFSNKIPEADWNKKFVIICLFMCGILSTGLLFIETSFYQESVFQKARWAFPTNRYIAFTVAASFWMLFVTSAITVVIVVQFLRRAYYIIKDAYS